MTRHTRPGQGARPATHDLALVGAVDPALLDLVELTLTGHDALVIRASYATGEDGQDVVRLTSHGTGEDASLLEDPATLDVPLTSSCLTCSLRDVLAAVAEDRAADEPGGATVVLLPPAVELPHLVPGLARALATTDDDGDDGAAARLVGTAHVLDAGRALDDLLDHHPLADEGLALHHGDERCTGEVHVVNIGYADVVVSLGHGAGGAGADLIEHLRPLDTLLLPGLDAPLLDCLREAPHDAAASLARVHPATTSAWGGPDQHGVRTLDLSSDMPFHPGRLRELVGDLAGHGLLARGCFWVPSRPGRVCAWEVAGGVVSVGDAGGWAEVEGAQARCHLVVTGLADDEQCDAVRHAFEQILLRPEELTEALAWIGASDGLEEWLGDPV